MALWIVGAPMNARRFEPGIETHLAAELQPADTLILGDAGFHRSERAAELVHRRSVKRCRRHALHILARSTLRQAQGDAARSKLDPLLRGKTANPSRCSCNALAGIREQLDPEQCAQTSSGPPDMRPVRHDKL